ncbi:hypothetical protein KR222_003954, partial [Zaprionus bogoriensis]
LYDMYFKMLATLLCLSLLSQAANGFMITVDAHETVCFYDRAAKADKITISFEVMEGGFMDIALHITGPNNIRLHSSESETRGSYTFAATNSGMYTLCFDNERSTLTPKVLMFHFTVVKSLAYYLNTDKRADSVVEQSVLQEHINSLSSQMLAIKHEQEYMRVRFAGHNEVNQSVHFRILAWSIFGPSLLLLMTLTEVYYLKRFFEFRRVV